MEPTKQGTFVAPSLQRKRIQETMTGVFSEQANEASTKRQSRRKHANHLPNSDLAQGREQTHQH